MPDYGLTQSGLIIKNVEVLRNEMELQLRQIFGSSIKLGDESIFGQLVAIIAERYAVLWELVEVLNSSFNPDKATGAALEALALLTGTLRPVATFSAVALVLSGADATNVPAGSEVRTTSTEQRFFTMDDVTLNLLADWVNGGTYAVGDRVTTLNRTYQCITAGTSGPNGPTGTDPDIDEGTGIHWTYLGEGVAAADVLAQASETGPVTGEARDITTIINGIFGWDSVINLTAANKGRNIATDGELRLLREDELATGGSTPVDALRAELLNVADVVAATIFVNNTDFTDGDGLPPHSIEALVRGPDTPTLEFDQSIFDTLLAGVAAGIQTYASPSGNPVTGTAVDSQGTEYTMNFSRPENVNIYVDIALIVDADIYPSDGDNQVKQQIVQWGSTQNTGKNAVSSRIGATSFNVPGVIDVEHCFIDIAPVPSSSATIPISLRQLAIYTTANINVSTTPGVP